MTKTMKAIAIQSFGGPDGLQLVERPVPRAGSGQVVVRVEAAGIGYADVLIRRGALAAYGFREGFVPGGEVAGIVVETGPDVDASWNGRRVLASLGAAHGGGYAEYAVAAVSSIVALPDSVSGTHAVALPNAVVAKYGLERLGVRRGDRLLVRGVSGGIGLMAAQLASKDGITVVGTTSSIERGERLARYGVTGVVDRAGNAFDGSVVEPFDAILDVVAGPDLASFFDKLRPGGRVVLVGMVGGPPAPDFGMAMFRAFQKSYVFSTLSLDVVGDAERNATTRELVDQAARGVLEAVVSDPVPLADASVAHRRIEAGVFGKLVLAP